MRIILNGTVHDEFEAPLSVVQLLERLGLSGQPVLVELDEIALRPRDYADSMIVDGAKLEIIRIAAGG